jgi:hypothetical protein
VCGSFVVYQQGQIVVGLFTISLYLWRLKHHIWHRVDAEYDTDTNNNFKIKNNLKCNYFLWFYI